MGPFPGSQGISWKILKFKGIPHALSGLHITALCRGSTGVPLALLAPMEMKGMIGERFHFSGLSAL
jgi:hypothetical protein